MSVFDEITAERARADAKHGTKSINRLPAEHGGWLAILAEELGEVAHANTYDADKAQLRGELIQVAAVAVAWVDALDGARVEVDVVDAVVERAAQAGYQVGQLRSLDREETCGWDELDGYSRRPWLVTFRAGLEAANEAAS